MFGQGFPGAVHNRPQPASKSAAGRLNLKSTSALFSVCSRTETKPMSATQAALAADEVGLDEAETVALAYFQAAQRNGWSALVALAADALAERDDLEDRLRQRGRQISHGYVRGRIEGEHVDKPLGTQGR